MAVLEPIQAAAVGADPQGAVGVQMQALDEIAGKSVGFSELFHDAVLQPAQPAAHHAKPHCSIRGFGNGPDIRQDQILFRAITGDRAGLIAHQTGVGSNPGHALALRAGWPTPAR